MSNAAITSINVVTVPYELNRNSKARNVLQVLFRFQVRILSINKIEPIVTRREKPRASISLRKGLPWRYARALEFGHLQKVASGNLRPEAEGAGGLSPGFQPGEPTN
jgi:hypothetical protein